MTTTVPAAPRRPRLRFVAHYLEMVVAMVVGMVALAPLWPEVWRAEPAAAALIMATDMTVAMGAWMLLRRHAWRPVLEMCAIMVAPFVVLLIPLALGLISGTALMILAHVIMFPLMLVAMIWRRHEYC